MAQVNLLNTIPRSLARRLNDLRRCESGATSIEYGLIVSLIFLAIIAAIRQVSGSTSDMYGEIEGAMQESIE